MISVRIDQRLPADFSWVLSGNIVYSACQWAIVVFLAKLGSAEQVGLYALGMAVSAPILVFANLQLRTLLASDVKNQFTFGQYLAFCLVSMGVAFIAIVAVAAWTVPDWPRRGVIVLVGFAQVLEYVSDTYYGLMQRYGRMDRMSRSLIYKGSLSLAALCAALYVTRNVAWGVLGLALGRLFILLIWDSRLRYTTNATDGLMSRLEWNSADMLRLLRMALPLGVISMLLALSGNIPRYFIEAQLGTTDLGIYAAIASLLTAGTMVVSAFGQSIMVPAAKACAGGDRAKYRGFVIHTVALSTVLGVGAVLAAGLFGRYLLIHLFRAEYAEHADVFVWLMSASTILFVTAGLGYVMTAARALKPQVPLLLAKCLATAAASAWFIPKHGLRGAAEAILVAALVQLIGSCVILLRIDRRFATAALSVPAPEPAGSQARA
jgi:O-antigen/teichoic acid export membrane protein